MCTKGLQNAKRYSRKIHLSVCFLQPPVAFLVRFPWAGALRFGNQDASDAVAEGFHRHQGLKGSRAAVPNSHSLVVGPRD